MRDTGSKEVERIAAGKRGQGAGAENVTATGLVIDSLMPHMDRPCLFNTPPWTLKFLLHGCARVCACLYNGYGLQWPVFHEQHKAHIRRIRISRSVRNRSHSDAIAMTRLRTKMRLYRLDNTTPLYCYLDVRMRPIVRQSAAAPMQLD
ncbi:hypothetical protein EVAR_16650_1 [Eumeta japonica]|uniref:Uncharacterized protein n=1 Tax=Eumeta variegata TaxID=151549 RepID=A0A4C1UZJ0_EUMVA|nr:hypothetical protein EVAR_16650_1 [Eumeta japonica]